MSSSSSTSLTATAASAHDVLRPRRVGQWWSWGAGTHGQLATGSFHDELLPVALSNLSYFSISCISCGGSHAAAVLHNGQAITWGNGSSGQLGHGDTLDLCEPTIVNCLHSIKVKSVSVGWSHTVFISENHELFTCGSGGFGQLGHGNFDSYNIPRKVLAFNSKIVLQAACGMRHTLVLVAYGEDIEVYSFGLSKRGQLGIRLHDGNISTVRGCMTTPQNIRDLSGCDIASIHANADHSAILSSVGELYIWGRDFGTQSNIFLPVKVASRKKFLKVALGWNHLLALTSDGEVYVAGSNRYGCDLLPLSSVHSTDVMVVSDGFIDIFDPLKGVRVESITAGSEHSAVVADDGSVMTWGWGEHGQLGLGATNDKLLPDHVSVVPKIPGSQVFAGSGFTFLYQQ